ncbi:A/G-specific adenine glycosylase [Alkalibacterium sp. AK22]|uniref:A/G-specific adenine glycosylase n=1 Tax=Alkalibacterium sp. AK22 TaxID=1229520 RepID=UPI0005510A97|nr:A/G-specific adenine glycosylase [Alkalibacterium sp. AK22]
MWEEGKIEAFRQRLLTWYDKQKRDLPWRQTSDPYCIWVSEIMLQQTQVNTVIPYYERFIGTLPTIKDLAEAPEDVLLKLWEGLGYYSRVRNMKVAANQVMNEYGGLFPTEHKQILKLKGIGPYTAGAVSSIAFNQPEPAVDGNVMRVLSRLFEIDLDIGKASSRKVFEEMIRLLIDPDRPGDFNQALMDLGATVCTPKNYHPETSPVRDFNASYLNDSWKNYPVKKSKTKQTEEEYIVLGLINNQGEYAFEKRGSKGVLSGMLVFIMVDRSLLRQKNWKEFHQDPSVIEANELETLTRYLKQEYGLEVNIKNERKGKCTHIFSHLKWQLDIYEGMILNESPGSRELHYIHPDAFDRHPFPVPTQKVWDLITKITLF